MTPADDVRKPTLAEQIEAVEFHAGIRSVPASYSSKHEYAALRAAAATLLAVQLHNSECLRICGEGDQEGVRCQYRPYFPRRCPECSHNWMIDV